MGFPPVQTPRGADPNTSQGEFPGALGIPGGRGPRQSDGPPGGARGRPRKGPRPHAFASSSRGHLTGTCPQKRFWGDLGESGGNRSPEGKKKGFPLVVACPEPQPRSITRFEKKVLGFFFLRFFRWAPFSIFGGGQKAMPMFSRAQIFPLSVFPWH